MFSSMPAPVSPDPVDIPRLNQYLTALASPIRLRLLWALRDPTRASDVRIRAEAERGELRAERPLARSTILHHLLLLEEVGLLERLEEERFVVNQQILFSILEDLARLSRLAPAVAVDVGNTLPTKTPATASALATGPKLVLVGGPREGEVFVLEGAGPWTIGRGREADLCIDYDPHVSRLHLRVQRDGKAGFCVLALPESMNPSSLDFRYVEAGGSVPLRAGAATQHSAIPDWRR